MPRERFDVDRVRLRQYRSIESCDVPLGPLTILVGPNGAGKSNFVDSLRFVAQSLNEGLDHALRERGGVKEVRRNSMGHPHHFSIRLNCRTDQMSAEYMFEIGARAGGHYVVTKEECRVVPMDPGEPERVFKVREGTVQDTTMTTMPRVLPDRLALLALSGDRAFRPLVDGLTGINVYSLNPEQMRMPQKPDPGELLRRDGANVASVVEAARNRFPEEMTLVERYLGLIVPGVKSVGRRDVGGWDSLEIRQDVAGSKAPWKFPASSMSDGTLRALGVLVALFASDPGSPSPVAIEEPETALHPAASGVLLEALVEASLRRQVLATSHSPDLIDSPALQSEHLLAVRAEAGKSMIERIDPTGAQALKDQLFTAGELLRADQLVPASSVGATQAELF